MTKKLEADIAAFRARYPDTRPAKVTRVVSTMTRNEIAARKLVLLGQLMKLMEKGKKSDGPIQEAEKTSA